MTDDDCIHGMNPTWCATCTGADAGTRPGDTYGYYGGETKQDLLDELCAMLGLPAQKVGAGSSLPSDVFQVAARRVGVSGSSMPEIGRAIAEKADLAWTDDCDSTGSLSGGGSTVTATGMRRLLDALGKVL